MDIEMFASSPGYIFALSYALTAALFSFANPPKGGLVRCAAVRALLVAGTFAFAFITDMDSDFAYYQYLYVPDMLAVLALVFSIIALTCAIPARNSLYFTIYAFLVGEFMAGLSWQFFLFFVSGGPGMSWNILFLLCYGLTAVGMLILVWLYERRYISYNAQLRLSGRTVLSTFLVALGVFLFSNISNVYRNTPFSGQTALQINLIRTLTDAGGLVLLEATRMLREDVSRRTEVEMLQKLIEVQYNNYKVSEQSIALVHQKYHDLKHQIAWLRDEAPDAERTAYLDRMEADIRAFEAGSDTGNCVLDTIITAKAFQCQHQGITLTSTVDGRLVDFMDPMDLSALFGNLLDNAIEHADRLADPEKRWIQLSVRRKNDFVVLEVGNHYEGTIRFRDGLPVTTKDDGSFHGFGTKSIRETVRRYGGHVSFTADKGWFEVKAAFVRSA